MKNIERGSTDTGMLYWRLESAFAKDPLIQMLSENIRQGIARSFHDQCVIDGKIALSPAEPNVKNVMRWVLNHAPLGWVGDEFKKYVEDVAVAALLPEGDKWAIR